MSSIASNVGFSALRQTTKVLQDVARETRGASGSLVDYTSSARVEPLVLLDNNLLFDDITPDVMQTMLAMFSGYYLQAWSLSAQIGNIDVMRQLDKLNPNRDFTGAVLTKMESFRENNDLTNRLPVAGDRRFALESEVLAMEASTGQEAIREIREQANLCVGKLLNVEVTDGEKKAEIQVAVRLMVNTIPPDSLINILSIGSQNVSLKERYHQWRSGQIEFFKDLILCQDLIDAHKKNLISDKTGLYQAIRNRSSKNLIAGVLTGNFSVATASNIAVVSSESIAKLEATIGGSMKDFRTRQKVFENTYLMIMAVVDREWQRVTIYTRGIPDITSVSARDLKQGNKGNGPDVGDILQAYKVGHSPSL